jgi:RNA polymerase sigma-70 factor (ECF subfamily)
MTPGTAIDTRGGTPVQALYETYRQPVLAYLTRLVSDRETAEDLCQETFIKAMRGWMGRDPAASERAWLYRIATNTAYDHLRRRRRIRFQTLEAGEGLEPAQVASVESQVAEQEPIRSALAQLPEIYRLPLVLHTCEGRSTQEIAARLGVSNSAVKTRLFRARERFRAVYQG